MALEEGRLDLHEYDERLQAAYGAKTYGELDELLTDLPGTATAERARVARRPVADQPADGIRPRPGPPARLAVTPGRAGNAGALCSRW